MYGKGKYAFLLLLIVLQAIGQSSTAKEIGLPSRISRAITYQRTQCTQRYCQGHSQAMPDRSKGSG